MESDCWSGYWREVFFFLTGLPGPQFLFKSRFEFFSFGSTHKDWSTYEIIVGPIMPHFQV